MLEYEYIHLEEGYSCSRWNGEEDASNVTLACDDDAHKVVLCTCSIFFKIR